MSGQDVNKPTDPSFGMKLTLAGVRTKFSDVQQLSTDELYSMWLPFNSVNTSDPANVATQTMNNIVLLDVREENERLISFISGSIWIDSNQDQAIQVEKAQTAISEKLMELVTKYKEKKVEDMYVIAYCSLGYRSSNLIRHLLKTDMSFISSDIAFKFYNLDGSIFKWANEGKPIVDSNDFSTPFVHPFNAVWGKLLNEDLRKWSN